jgi:signal transduction histidine kinase
MSDRPIRVLLVDDDEDFFVLTRGVLSDIADQQYHLDWQASYESALTALECTPYDICLFDYRLSHHTGLDLLREVSARGSQVPMILLTSQGDHALDMEAMRAGACDYLPKGLADPDMLERSIRYAIAQSQALAALRASQQRIDELYRYEQKQRRELERAYAELRQSETLRDSLTHMIVHDLRNPLMVITANLELVARVLHDPERSSHPPGYFLERAHVAGERMARMIDDLLDVGKFESGELRPVPALLSFAKVLLEKGELYRPEAEKDNKTILVRVPADLPPVIADINLVERVMDNLISNALKYTDPGSRIELGAEQNDRNLIVCVRDDGQGIPPEYLNRIFDKFAQVVDANGVPLRKGSGLGLAFCRSAVKAHGGKIWAESILGRGSSFYFTLPLQRPLSP